MYKIIEIWAGSKWLPRMHTPAPNFESASICKLVAGSLCGVCFFKCQVTIVRNVRIHHPLMLPQQNTRTQNRHIYRSETGATPRVPRPGPLCLSPLRPIQADHLLPSQGSPSAFPSLHLLGWPLKRKPPDACWGPPVPPAPNQGQSYMPHLQSETEGHRQAGSVCRKMSLPDGHWCVECGQDEALHSLACFRTEKVG